MFRSDHADTEVLVHGWREWREAASLSDALLTISPARLRALNEEIWQLILKYRQDETLPDEDGAAQVHVFLSSFPRAEGGR